MKHSKQLLAFLLLGATLHSPSGLASDLLDSGSGGTPSGCEVWICPITCTTQFGGASLFDRAQRQLFGSNQPSRDGNIANSCSNRSFVSKFFEGCAEAGGWVDTLKNLVTRCSKNSHNILHGGIYDIPRFFPRLAQLAKKFDELPGLICDGGLKNLGKINTILNEISTALIREAEDISAFLRPILKDIENLEKSIIQIRQQLLNATGQNRRTLTLQLSDEIAKLEKKVDAYNSARGRLQLLKDIWEQSVGLIERNLCEPRVTAGGQTIQNILDSHRKL